MHKSKGFAALLLTGFIFGWFGILIRFLNTQLGPYQQIAFRHIIGLVFITAIFLFIKVKWSLKKVRKDQLFLYALTYPLSIIFVTLAFINAKVAVAVFSIYSSELLTAFIIGRVLFKEKVTRVKIISQLLVLAGLFFLTYPLTVENINSGFLYGIIAGFIWVISNSVVKHLNGKIDSNVLVFIQMLSGTLIAAGLSIITTGTSIPVISMQTLLIGIVYGALIIAVGYFIVYGFQNFDLHLGTIIVSSELIFGPLLAAIIFKEFPTVTEATGGGFILAAIILPHLLSASKDSS